MKKFTRLVGILLTLAMLLSMVPATVVGAVDAGTTTGTDPIAQGRVLNIYPASNITTVFGCYTDGTGANESTFSDGNDGYCVTDGWFGRAGYSERTPSQGLIALVMTLSKPINLGGMEMVSHGADYSPTDFVVQAQVNGSWVTVFTQKTNAFTSNMTQMFDFGTSTTTSKVRVLINKTAANGQCRFKEVTLYEASTGNKYEIIDLNGRGSSTDQNAANPVSYLVNQDKSDIFLASNATFDLTKSGQPTSIDGFNLYCYRGNSTYPSSVTVSVQKTAGGAYESIGTFSTHWGNKSPLDTLHVEFGQTYNVYGIKFAFGAWAYMNGLELFQFVRGESDPEVTEPAETEPATPPVGGELVKLNLAGTILGVCSEDAADQSDYTKITWYSDLKPGWKDVNIITDGNYANEIHWGCDPNERADVYFDLTKINGSAVAVNQIRMQNTGYQAVSTVKVVLVLKDGSKVEKTLNTNWQQSASYPDLSNELFVYDFDKTYEAVGMYVWQNNNSRSSFGDIELYQLVGTVDPDAPVIEKVTGLAPEFGYYTNGTTGNITPYYLSGREPANLVDGSSSTQTRSDYYLHEDIATNAKTPVILFNLGESKVLTSIKIEGYEYERYNIEDFDIQVSNTTGADTWVTVASIENAFRDGANGDDVAPLSIDLGGVSANKIRVLVKGITDMSAEMEDETDTELLLGGYIRLKEITIYENTNATAEEPQAHQHTEVIDKAVAATCTTTGLTEGKHCSACGEVLVAQQVVPATGHTYTSEQTKAPTCTTAGEMTYTCSCGDTYTEAIAAHGHSLTSVSAKAPTCTEPGYEAYEYCSVCDYTTYVAIPATGHTYEAVVTAPTCTEAGYTTYTCACGDTYTADEVAATGHTYTAQQTKAPTCTETGVMTYTCACGDTYTEEIKATGHTLTSVDAKAPTCTEAGYEAYEYCSVCDYTTFVAIPATGHTYETVVTDPTCTENGYTTYTCACGDTYIDDEVSATGHTYTSEQTKAPTCTVAGVMTYTCTCGDTFTEEIAATGHTLTSVDAKAPTCTEAGYEAYEYCSVCDYTTFAEIPATGHTYDAVVTAPTCTEAGYTTYTCACGDTYTADEVPATGHTYASEQTKAPTCTVAGVMTYTCACGDTYTEEIAATGHTLTAVDAKAPTCTETGYEAYEYCSVCDYTTYVAIPATGHTHTAEQTKAPTCTEAGEMTYTCACGDTYTEEIAAIGHTLIAVDAKAPTCTEAGNEAYEYCSACDYTTFVEIPATGHTYDAVVTAPTCTEAGYTTYTCACGDTYTADEVPALGHTHTSEQTKAPTCTEAGETTYTCSCGNTYTEAIAATGHTLTSVDAKAPTCTEDGYKAYEYCSVCDYTTFEAVSATGHTYDAVVTAPTCTDDGYTTHTCACGDTYTTDFVPATGHTYTSEQTKAPTCTEAGETTYTCSCGDTYTEEIKATGHTLTSVDAKAPTCTEAGNEAYEYCSVCDYTTFVEIPATGHTYEAVVTAPTCTEAGYTTYTCACGDTYTADEVAALGHTYTAVVTPAELNKQGYTTYTCSCGDTYVADYTPALKGVASIGDYGYATLEEALAAAKAGDTIVLNEDVKASKIITINKGITLDGNGKTLTSTAARAINVDGANGATIKNLTINASGERAINVINGATNLTINNVTATAANYAVNVAGSGANAVITINDSNLTGLATVNVAGAGTQIEINNTVINNVDTSSTESYGAITISPDAAGAVVVVNGGEINVSDDSHAGIVFPVDAEIEGVADVAYIVATIGAAGYYTLEDAIADAKAGATIKLVRDVELSESVKIDKAITIDLNGKTISATYFYATYGVIYVTKTGNLTVKGEGTITSPDLTIGNYGVVTVEKATISGGYAAIYNFYYSADVYGKTVINGGAVEGWLLNSGELAINGGAVDYVDNSGALAVNGGSIEYVYGRDGSDAAGVEGAGTIAIGDTSAVEVPEDYKLVEVEEGVYKVVAKDYVAEIVGGEKYENLQDAIDAADGKTVTLLADVDLGTNLLVDNTVTLDLNGKKIYNSVDIWNERVEPKIIALIKVTANGNLTIVDSSADQTGSIIPKANDAYGIAIYDGICTIKAGTISGNITAVQLAGGKLSIEGGHFYLQQKYKGKSDYLLNMKDKSGAEIVVSGGTFVEFNPYNNKADGKNTNYVVDGYHYADEDGDKVFTIHAENYTAVKTEPTCTEAGYTTYTCTCGETYTADEVPATGHTYDAVVTDPTCTEAGYTTYTCACGDTYTADEVPALGHSYTSEQTKAPTCTEAGEMTYTCSCGDTYTEEIKATGHTLTSVNAKAPTCTEAGHEAYEYCSVCDYTTFVEIPATGHTHTPEQTKAPTCTTAGVMTYTCSCGDSYTEEIKATGHTEVEDANGTHCDVCGEILSTKEPVIVETNALSQVTYNVRLIEPWAIRINVKFFTGTQSSPKNVPVSSMTSYGAYGILASKYENAANMSIEELIADPDAVKIEMSATEADGSIYPVDANTLRFDFSSDVYTYRLSEDVYWIAYYADADGNLHFTRVRNKNLTSVMNSLTSAREAEKNVYTSMQTMEQAIIAYRGTLSNLTTVYPAGVNITESGIGFAADNAPGTYKFAQTHSIKLIEPWGIKVNVLMVKSTNTSKPIDYAAADDYGLIFFHDKAGEYEGGMSVAQMLAEGDAVVYSKSLNNVTIEANRVSAIYDQNIFTFEMDSDLYVLPFVVIDGEYHYRDTGAFNMNLIDRVALFATETTKYSAEERAVYTAMVEMNANILIFRGM